jgi:hypothetical protein
MPIPRGFVEVHPLEDPPFLAPAHLRRGAIVKYLHSRETTGTDHSEEAEVLNGYISRAGVGRMVHEFTTRGGLGLPFKLIGEPTLTARLCAIKQGWVIWIEQTASGAWDVGAAVDLVKLRALAVRMRNVDDELDRAVLEAAGAFQAGTRTVGIEDVTAPARNVAASERAQRRAEKLKAPAQLRRVRMLLRKLVAIGPRRLADVRRAFAEAGYTLEQLEAAAVDLGAIICRSTKRGPQSRARLIGLPSSDSYPARTIAESATAVRREIARDVEQEEALEREARRMARVEPSEEGESVAAASARWIREQLASGPRRLGDLRREIPAPELSDQVARDEWFVVAARMVGVIVQPHGPRRLKGFWIELAPPDTMQDDAPLLHAMQREGSPHIEYPKPRKWY